MHNTLRFTKLPGKTVNENVTTSGSNSFHQRIIKLLFYLKGENYESFKLGV